MKRIVLNNSVRVLLQHNSGARTATVAVFTGAGSRYESLEEHGFSHFVEHMVFKGTTHRTALEIANETDMIGGQLNAFTTKEYTCFYARVLPEFDARGMEIVADLAVNPVFGETDIETERGVIMEEIAMYEDDPEELAADGIFESAWSPDPLGRCIVGTRESVAGVTADKLRDFHARFYRPENIVVAVSGRFDEDRVLDTVRRMLGDMPAGGFTKPTVSIPTFNRGNVLSLPKTAEQLQFCMAFPCIGIGDERGSAISLLNSVSGGGASSRLFQRLREQLGLAYSLYTYFTAHVGCGIFVISGGISPKSKKKALSEIENVLDGLRGGITESELLRAKNQVRSGLAMSYENTYNLAMDMGRRELFGLPQRSQRQSLALVSKVTADGINAEARELFDMKKSCLCFAGAVGRRRGQ